MEVSKKLVRVCVEGVFPEGVLPRLKNEGIEVYNAKKIQKNRLEFCIERKNRQKVFTILNHSCYNILRIQTFGLAAVPHLLRKNAFLLIGGVVCLAACALSSLPVLKISVSGSGSFYRQEIVSYLAQEGVTLGRVANREKIENASNKILSLPQVGFCSIQKQGSILKVTVEILPESEGRETEEEDTAHIKNSVDAGDNAILQKILGNFDENLNVLTKELQVIAYVDGTKICVEGEEENVLAASRVLTSLIEVAQSVEIDKSRLYYCIELDREGKDCSLAALSGDAVAVTFRGKPVKCKTLGQKKYVSDIQHNTVVFGVGPAGTGKTYLAVCLAVTALKCKQVEKIILTRPAVEAGEKLGFLPGDLQTKVDPYLRPLYDALQDMLGAENYAKYMERGIIEIAPLAYMRGRTLSNAFIILDEAQNTTREQMKMFLTRMGENSRMVVTGDLTQVDLPEGKRSGLAHAVRILKGIEGIAVCRLTDKDVVRHPLVMQIIRAYEREENAVNEKKLNEGEGDK